MRKHVVKCKELQRNAEILLGHSIPYHQFRHELFQLTVTLLSKFRLKKRKTR